MNPNKTAFTTTQRQAIQFILLVHGTQRRVGTVLPYVVHPIEVASFVGRFYPDNHDLVIAAYLHDVLEDTDVTEHRLEVRFGKTITGLVKEVTARDDDFPDWVARRQHQIDHMKEISEDAVRLKACDMLSNSLAIGFDYLYRPDEGYPKFKKDPEQVIWYYQAAWEVMYSRLKSSPVLNALHEANGVWR